MTPDSGGLPQSEREQQRLRHLLELNERERRLMAYDIHDGFVQEVVSAQLVIDSMLDRLAETDPESVPPLLRVRAFVRKAIDESRRIVSELRPGTTDDSGLVEAIQFLVGEAETTGKLVVSFDYPKDFPRLSPLLERSLARIVQESITNIKRHAKTKNADVRLAVAGKNILLEIADAGVGFDPSAIPSDRYGLEGMRERALIFGGSTEIRSKPGEGTLISVSVPIESPDVNGSAQAATAGTTRTARRKRSGNRDK